MRGDTWRFPPRVAFGEVLASGDVSVMMVISHENKFFITPLKMNMEPENHPCEKEHHLPNLHFPRCRLGTEVVTKNSPWFVY